MATKALIINGDDSNTLKAVSGVEGKKIISFGIGKENNYYADNIRKISGMETEFEVYRNGSLLGNVTLHVAGTHNVLNVLRPLRLPNTQAYHLRLLSRDLMISEAQDGALSLSER